MPFEGVDFAALQAAVENGGGEMHGNSPRNRSVVHASGRALDELRASYLLRYRPAGVNRRGWHTIGVSLKKPGRHLIQARRGYFSALRERQ